jgi:hypothetical protein
MSKNAQTEVNVNVNDIIAQLSAKQPRSTGKNRTILITATGDTKAKIAPQGRVILIALLSRLGAGNPKITEHELAELLNSDEVKTALKTKQDPWRIWSFHRKEIMDAGFLSYEGEAPTPASN